MTGAQAPVKLFLFHFYMRPRQITQQKTSASSRVGPVHNNLKFGRPNVVLPKTAWVTAPPKSGSTWLSMMLAWLLDWDTMSLIAKPGRQEQELRITRRFVAAPTNIFMPHTHTKAGEGTISFVKTFGVSVIIPTRGILDNLVSVYDHLVNLGVALPIGFFPPTFKGMPLRDQKSLLINIAVPWYMSFYASWAYAEVEHGLKPLYLPYEETTENPHHAMYKCMKHIGVQRTDDQIKAAVDQSRDEPTRFNYGIIGRGIEFFDSAERSYIMDMISSQKDPIIRDSLTRITSQYGTQPIQQTTEAGISI